MDKEKIAANEVTPGAWVRVAENDPEFGQRLHLAKIESVADGRIKMRICGKTRFGEPGDLVTCPMEAVLSGKHLIYKASREEIDQRLKTERHWISVERAFLDSYEKFLAG